MTFTIHIDRAEFVRAITPGASRFIRDVALDVRAEIGRLFGLPKTGRIYRRPKPVGGLYRASAPGEPPAIRTGRLFRSRSERQTEPTTWEMLIDTPYAAILEGLERSRMAPRPFVVPAIRNVRERLNRVKI